MVLWVDEAGIFEVFFNRFLFVSGIVQGGPRVLAACSHRLRGFPCCLHSSYHMGRAHACSHQFLWLLLSTILLLRGHFLLK